MYKVEKFNESTDRGYVYDNVFETPEEAKAFAVEECAKSGRYICPVYEFSVRDYEQDFTQPDVFTCRWDYQEKKVVEFKRK